MKGKAYYHGGLLLTAVLLAPLVCEGRLNVVECSGQLCVERNGKELISSIAVDRGGIGQEDVQTSFTVLQDGSRVWNRWSEQNDRRFRLEVAARADGAVEITLLGSADADSQVRNRYLNLAIPGVALRGKSYRCITSLKANEYAEGGEKFTQDMQPFFTRYLAADGIVWDFNPLGVGDFSGQVVRTERGNQLNRNGVIGYWEVSSAGSNYRFSSGDRISASWGGFTGGKVVIREGEFGDYGKIHFMTNYMYHWPIASKVLLKFGAPIAGKCYADGDVSLLKGRGVGWLPSSVMREKRVGYPEGVFYSAVSGSGDASYRVSGLSDGFYVLTLAFGNYAGMDNRFSVGVNGEPLLTGVRVPPRMLRTYSRAVHLTGGRMDISFSGDWLISSLGLQPLLADGEDFSVSRGFWLADGYEPCAVFRNADARRPFSFGVYDETEPLPVPGTETVNAPHLPPAPIERPPADHPGVAWMKKAKMKLLLANSATLSEFDTPGSLDRYLDREWKENDVGAVMLSGMHSRHTYPGDLDRGVSAIGRMTETLHRRGVKVIDHHDSTLLWNDVAGFRVMMERLGETIRTIEGALPSDQLCYSNPLFRETYYAYLRKLIAAGVDGFQIDELEFWRHGCSCRHCRDTFRKDTGWTIPLNECDAAWNDPRSELRRRWQDWRKKTTANWYVEFRRRMKDLRDDLALSIYTTPSGFVSPLPMRNASIDQMELSRVLNYFGTEMMTRSALRTGRNLMPYARMKNVLSGPDLPPVWTWYYNVDPENNYFAWGLSSLAGQTPLLSDVPLPEEFPRFEEFGASSAALQRTGAEEVGEVVLLFSQQSRDWNEGVSFWGELFGTAQTLETMHVPYRFVDDRQLERGVPDGCKVLFLGESQCLSDEEVAAVRAFAERGGVVRLTIRAGERNEFGLPRKERPFPASEGFVRYDKSPAEKFALGETWSRRVWPLADDPAGEDSFVREIEGWTSTAGTWRIDAPKKVFTSVWREKTGDYVVQFLNGGGVQMKKGDAIPDAAPCPAFPEIGEDMAIAVRGLEVKEAVAVSPDFVGVRRLGVRRDAQGRIEIGVPSELLKAYVLVRIKVEP